MLALLNWRVWVVAGVAGLLALAAWTGYTSGTRHVQAQWDAEKSVQRQAAATVEIENRRIENKRQTGVIDAQNAQVQRTAALQMDAAAARAAADRLRDTLRTAAAALPGHPDDARSQHTDAASELLAVCARSYSDMAATADAHASDSLMLQEAWPR